MQSNMLKLNVLGKTIFFKVKRVRKRAVVVVVVVKELLFLVMSVICMQIRGRGQRLPQLLTTFV